MKTAIILLCSVLASLASAISITEESVFLDIYDFDRGLLSGFANRDLSHSDQCLQIFDKVKQDLNEVWDDFAQMKNETQKMEALRDILHVVQKLPVDFKGCQEISSLVESLAKKVILILDIDDFIIRASKNMLYNALDIMSKVTEAGVNIMNRNYYKSGFYLGRALDLLLQ